MCKANWRPRGRSRQPHSYGNPSHSLPLTRDPKPIIHSSGHLLYTTCPYIESTQKSDIGEK
jgi:hypothetical protein